MSKSAHNLMERVFRTFVRADYYGDAWRAIAATYPPILLAILYWWGIGASLPDVINAVFVYVVLFGAFQVWLSWMMIRRTSADQTRGWALSQGQEALLSSRWRRSFFHHASGHYPGWQKLNFSALRQAASFGGLVLAFGIVEGRTSEDGPPILLSVLGVVVFWAMLHTSYALYYAYLYYAGDSPGGLEFPGGEEPDHMDFAYYAFAVGTTFGTSDVTVTSKRLRRTTLVHGVLSFVYGTAVLAIVINALIRGF